MYVTSWNVYDYPEPPNEPPVPTCPICSRECSTIYKDMFGVIFGCDECVKKVDADEEQMALI